MTHPFDDALIMQIKPDDAQSNLSAWLSLITNNVPSSLISPKADKWALAVLVLAGLLLWLGPWAYKRWAKRLRHRPHTGAKAMNDDEELRLLRRIEGLIVENKLLREALKPFADEGERIHDKRLPLGPDTDSWPVGSPYLTLGDLRRATVRTQEPKP